MFPLISISVISSFLTFLWRLSREVCSDVEFEEIHSPLVWERGVNRFPSAWVVGSDFTGNIILLMY